MIVVFFFVVVAMCPMHVSFHIGTPSSQATSEEKTVLNLLGLQVTFSFKFFRGRILTQKGTNFLVPTE